MVLTKLQEIDLLVLFFFISCFTVSGLFPKSFNDFIILTSLIPSFKIGKVNPSPALTAPFPLIFLSNLFIAFEVKLLTNPGKLSFAKGILIQANCPLLKV